MTADNDQESRIWELEKTPAPQLEFMRRAWPVDRFEARAKQDRTHGDPTL